MIRIKKTTSAITNKICINPPMVYEVTKPSIQRIIKTSAIVSSMLLLHSRVGHIVM